MPDEAAKKDSSDRKMSKHEPEECEVGPYPVTLIQHLVHNLKDGTRMAIKLFVPWTVAEDKGFIDDDAKKYTKQLLDGKADSEKLDDKFPSILEFIPYAKDSINTLARDQARHTWWCSHGFVCVRPDMRGSGDSGGLYFDEYEPQEQEDCLELIDCDYRLATREWSNGKVGMYGKSWGGFNGLQLAYLQPKALQAVISLYSTDDRYSDDIHYMGGCVIGNGMLSWAATMFALNARPLNPRYFSTWEEWKKEYLYRLENGCAPWDQIWLSHQRGDDPYWRHGSINEDMSAVKCPCFVIGGSADGYTNAAFRMAATLNDQSKGLIGPWGHDWPDVGTPGPNIDYLNTCLAWWNYYLKNPDRAAEDVSEWPALRLYLQDTHKPAKFVAEAPGTWINIPEWPLMYNQFVKTIDEHKFDTPLQKGENMLKWWFRDQGAMTNEQPAENDKCTVELIPDPLQGENAGEWLSWGSGADMPSDQTQTNNNSHCWVSPVLKREVIIAGFPIVYLNLEAKFEGKYGVAVRLCDQRPDGTSVRVTYGIQNLAQWRGQDKHEKNFPANRPITVPVLLNGCGYTIPRGHKMLISVTPTYFPIMFPMPENEGLIFYPEKSFALMQTVGKFYLKEDFQFEDPIPVPTPLPVNVERVPSIQQKEFNIEKKPDGTTVYSRQVVYDKGDTDFVKVGIHHKEKDIERFECNTDVTWGLASSEKNMIIRYYSPHGKEGEECEVGVHTFSVMEGDKKEFKLNNKMRITIDGQEFFKREYPEVKIPREYV